MDGYNERTAQNSLEKKSMLLVAQATVIYAAVLGSNAAGNVSLLSRC